VKNIPTNKYLVIILVIVGLVLIGTAGFVIRNITSVSPAMVVPQDNVPDLEISKVHSPEGVLTMTPFLSGSFAKIDAVHKGSGEAVVYKMESRSILRFENFRVTNGPDLQVYLSKNSNIQESKDLGEFVSLGALKDNKGEQSYNLPPDIEEYTSVVIWCRAFGVLFSVAELR